MVISRDRPQGFTSFITSPQTRKRAAADTIISQPRKRKATESIDVPDSKKPRTAVTSRAPLPSTASLGTPAPTTMDSDDEFMSGLSSQEEEEEFGGTEESDDGSLGDGMHCPKVVANYI